MSQKDQLKYRKFMLDIKNFSIVKQLQSGGFGSVFCVQKTDTQETFAAKVLTMKDDEKNYKRMISREIGIMVRCQHPTIIRFFGYALKDFNKQNNVTIFMELAKKGSLADLLHKIQKGLSDEVVNNTIRQIILVGIAYGMMFLHQNRIVHRDLKPENILLDEELHPHITDFGLSKFIESFSQSQSQQCGTCIYMAPEIIEGTHYNGKIDVYSFGILMYQVVTDTDPYPLLTKGKITPFKFNQKVVSENYRPTFTFPVKKSIQKLIERCWSKNPHERPTFEEIFKKLAYGSYDSIEDIYDERNEKEEEDQSDDDDNNRYYLDDVDVDEVISYAEDIQFSDNQFSNEDSDKVKQMVDRLIGPLKEENQKLKEKITKLENKLNNHIKRSEEIIDQQNKENGQLREIINELKEKVEKKHSSHSSHKSNKDESLKTKTSKTTITDDLPSPPPPPPASSTTSKSSKHQKSPRLSSSTSRTSSNEPPPPPPPPTATIGAPPPPPPPPKSPKSPSIHDLKERYDYVNEDDSLKGIIYNMTSLCKGSPIDHRFLKVTGSSSYGINYLPKFAADLSKNNCFISSYRDEEQWLSYDFEQIKIQPTFYTIKTPDKKIISNDDLLVNWVIEASNGKDSWQAIDTRCADLQFNDTQSFDIDHSKVKFKCFKYLRIRRTQIKSGRLAIEALEFFGKVIKP
ncbi:hypothetical protein M9Y10_028314 [Tritrichomonas musculus]|uniref:Protein kinase domain-containing protein n=1 Tax=Tritrichomonas musculus TaxID=1915356 RepID=A0ABR2KJ69_9EUKA